MPERKNMLKDRHFRVDEETDALLRGRKDVSRFIRRIVKAMLSGKSRPPYDEEIAVLERSFRELHRAGVNMNQIASRINTCFHDRNLPLPDVGALKGEVKALQKFRKIAESYLRKWH